MKPLSDRTVRHLREVLERPEIPGGRYEIRDRIARGGMGTVWRAHDTLLERDVALKVLSVADREEASLRRMLREARILASLEHPGIVPIHDLGRLDDERIWYAMKLVEGDRLDVHVRGVPDPARRLGLFERVCDAVAFAHARGVIHRDLKPENVMVGSFGEVLVVDWGVAKIRDPADAAPGGEGQGPAPASPGGTGASPHSPGPTAASEPDDGNVTHPGTVLGTPGYMAPEQAAGLAHLVDERSDVFALGMLLRRIAAPDGARLPPRLDAVARRAAAERPQERYASVSALMADVEAYQAGRSVSAYRENMWERAGRLVRRHRAAFLLVGVYILVRALMLLLARA